MRSNWMVPCVLGLLGLSQAAPPSLRQLPTEVWVCATISPEQAKQNGGFAPAQPDMEFADFSIYNHYASESAKSPYVSTWESAPEAEAHGPSQGGWLFKIHATENFVDVKDTLGEKKIGAPNSFRPMFAAAGGIRWDQTISSTALPRGSDTGKAARKEVPNKDYDKTKYQGHRASGAVRGLAGFPKEDKIWDKVPFKAHKDEDVKSNGLKFLNEKGAAALLSQGSGWPVKVSGKHPAAKGTQQASGQATAAKGSGKFVFYSDTISPAEAQKMGGFAPRHNEADGERLPTKIALVVSNSLGEAVKRAGASGGKERWVYAVHATPNMVKGQMANTPFALAVGGLVWPQVVGYLKVSDDFKVPEKPAGVKSKAELRTHFEKAITDFGEKFKPHAEKFQNNKDFEGAFDETKEQVGIFQQNKDYDKKKFTKYAMSKETLKPLFVSSDLVAFMDRNARAVRESVGWDAKTAALSALSKAAAAPAAAQKAITPHDEGIRSKTWDWVKSHELAVVLAPAVLALNLIPGVGELADGAEASLIAAESAEVAFESGLAATGEGAVTVGSEGVAGGVAGGVAEGGAGGAVEGGAEGAVQEGGSSVTGSSSSGSGSNDLAGSVEDQINNLPEPPNTIPELENAPEPPQGFPKERPKLNGLRKKPKIPGRQKEVKQKIKEKDGFGASRATA
ncbi:heat-labile enterotoxin A subunit [Moelleriella libera RCEF 2490]|uniref:Heat-labile enterotoxin A subunit n=1 Tax=Moelleriella libera RCEF 2490 TaxID=1081109 RepID=A0A168EKI9_9HYPO|nr:heat-labile enterotoxin A subunit [Moelleriella libera RCEF 2490]